MQTPGADLIHENAPVKAIVNSDYRTADVFRKYNIDFCCTGIWPLRKACELANADYGIVEGELIAALRHNEVSNLLTFEEWETNFLVDYIVNVHHAYLRKMLPLTKDLLREFVIGHVNQYPNLSELERQFAELLLKLFPHLDQEEESMFPYIKQLANAFHNNESYGDLFVRTLRKPIESIIEKDTEIMEIVLMSFRKLTQNYFLPTDACTIHQVVILKLRELDADLVQHIRLENEILFPRVLSIEAEILAGRSG